TLYTFPAINCNVRNVSVVILSRFAFPVLCAMIALVTLPLAVSTSITQRPLPVIWACFAAYGYWGRGALIAKALAANTDIGLATRNSAALGCEAEVVRLFT